MIEITGFSVNKEKTYPHQHWKVDWAELSDELQLLDLFKRSFNHDISVKQWRWKYFCSSPMGIVVRCQGDIIAFYGGMPRKIWITGQEAMAIQIGDVMVAPRYRRVFTRHGALFHAAKRFCEDLVGPDRPYACAYGFPSERHYRLGEHLGLYTEIGRLLRANLSSIPSRRHLFYSVDDYHPRLSDSLQALWQAMRAQLDAHVVLDRGKTYIHHRYEEHPEASYLLRVVRHRLSGRLLGFLALRDRGSDGVELLDVIGKLRHLSLLVSVARELAGQLGRDNLYMVLTEPVARAMAIDPADIADLNLPLPTFNWRQSKDILKTRNHWWLIGGDTDSH